MIKSFQSDLLIQNTVVGKGMKCDFQVVGNFQLFFLRLIILASLGVLRQTNFDRFHNGLKFILKEQSY